MDSCRNCGALLSPTDAVCSRCHSVVPPHPNPQADVPLVIGQAGWVPLAARTERPAPLQGVNSSAPLSPSASAVALPMPTAEIAVPAASATALPVSTPAVPAPHAPTQPAVPDASPIARPATTIELPVKRNSAAVTGILMPFFWACLAIMVAGDAPVILIGTIIALLFVLTRSAYQLFGTQRATVVGPDLVIERRLFGRTFRTYRARSARVYFDNRPAPMTKGSFKREQAPPTWYFSRGPIAVNHEAGVSRFGESLESDPTRAESLARQLDAALVGAQTAAVV